MHGIILKTIIHQVENKVNVPLKRVEEVFQLIKNNNDITSAQIAIKLEVSDKTVKRDIAKLNNKNRIIRVGSLKNAIGRL